MKRFFVAFWRQRHFVPAAISGEFKSRVARSKIGTVWFVLHPLAMALIYVLVLSEVLGAKLGGVEKSGAYAVFLLSGIAAWGFFSEILSRCISMFVEYANAMKKINFPKIYLPIVVIGGAAVTHALLLVAVIAIIAFYGFFPNEHWLSLFVVMLVSAALALGFGIVLGIMNIFTRDVSQVMMVVMNLWFWLTPIVYTENAVNVLIRTILNLNPMTPIVRAYQDVIVYGQQPNFDSLLFPLTVAAVMLTISSVIFWRASPELVDAL